MIEQIIKLLLEKGYQRIPEQRQLLFFCERERSVNLIMVLGFDDADSSDKCLQYARKFANHLAIKMNKNVEFLCLSVIPNGYINEEQRQLAENYQTLWFIAADTGRLFVFENQPLDFDNIYDELEFACKQATTKRVKKLPIINVSIVVINVILFLVMQLCLDAWEWDAVLERFAMDWKAVVFQKQWYRLLTCTFLHGDASHLYSNMLLLFFLGNQVERRIGTFRYGILYFVSGILASAGSCLYHYRLLSNVICLGASGAVYGVLGMMAGYLILHWGQNKNLSVKHFLIFVALSMLQGTASPDVDYMAHICGFIAGFIFSIVEYIFSRKRMAFCCK